MKFFKYIFFSFISCVGFTACVDDAIRENTGQTWQQGDVPYYITLKLKPSSETFTRAEGDNNQFENFQSAVTHDEHAISPNAHNFAIFFDENDKYISCADLYSVNETTEWDSGNNNDIPATEATYKCRFYGFADSKPAKVLVVVNAPDKIYDQITDFPGWNIEEVMSNQVWNEPGILNLEGKETEDSNGKVHIGDPKDNMGFYTESNTRFFTMTNSTYLTYLTKDSNNEDSNNEDSNNEESNNQFQLNCAQVFPEGSVTTDPSKIGTLTPVTVYLERMVSKFQLTTAFDAKKYIPTNAQALDVCQYVGGDFTYYKYNWGIQLLAWGVNGLETSNYLFKNVPYKDDDLTDNLKELYEKGWNSQYNKRCFWSKDPHYKTVDEGAAYPWQFDEARDRYDSRNAYYTHFQSYDNPESKYALAYYPFQSFCLGENGASFIKDDGTVKDFEYQGNSMTLYSPENTFVPGLIVDRSRGSRAYELAGTHILLCARLLLTDEEDFNGNIYKNRVGVTYVDEVSMFKDFMNAVNYQLNSQKYLYYKYYDWDNSGGKDDYRGHTIRARSEGDYALYCYFPYNTNNTTIAGLVQKAFPSESWTNGVIIELTHDLIEKLGENKAQYQLYRDADAINADGKVIPWIMYRNNTSSPFTPLRLMILERQPEDESKYDFIKRYDYGGSSDSGGEFILGDPNDKNNENSVGTYLSGTQGNKVGLSTWGTSVEFDNFKVTSSQGEQLFNDDFDRDSIDEYWNKENTATTGFGNWTVNSGVLKQTNTNMEGEILTVNRTFPRSYTIEVEAKVKEGREGFLIVFNYLDEKNYCWWNVGAWGNSRHELEYVKDGKKTYLEAMYESLQYDQPYNVRIQVDGSNVKCYLNNILIHEMNLPLGRELQFEAWETPESASDDYIGDDNDVQSIFFETWGVVDCFKNGLMYYAVPIYAQDNQGKPAIDYNAVLEEGINEDFIDEEKLRYYYGVVRNNWYKFSLHSINDIGIPVSDPTKPIVPNYDGKLDQNKVEMEILQWHMEDQTVEIPF